MISNQKMAVNSASREKAFTEALNKYVKFLPRIKNPNIIVVIDYTQPSYRKRLYVFENVSTEPNVFTWANTRNHHVAHGSGSSDLKDPTYSVRFGNTSNSHMSSLGAMVTVDTYHGKHGYSCRLEGLEARNSLVRVRSIVIHSADYVTDDYIHANDRCGQSWGCPAVDRAISNSLIQLIKGGCFVYAYF